MYENLYNRKHCQGPSAKRMSRAALRRGLLRLEMLEPRNLLAAVADTSFLMSGTLPAGSQSIVVEFDEAVLGADNASNYELRRVGNDGLLNTADDILESLNVTYNNQIAELSFAALAESVFRLTISDSITDGSGNALDGDGDGVAGGAWRKDFVVGAKLHPLESFHDFTFDPELGGEGIGQLVQGTSNAFDGLNRLILGGGVFVDQPRYESLVSEVSASLNSTLASAYADVTELTLNLSLSEESYVRLDSQFLLASSDNTGWSGEVRFVINDSAEASAAKFANPYVLPTLAGTTSSVVVSVDPPAVSTSTAGAHAHSVSGSTSVNNGGAFGVPNHSHSFSGSTSTAGAHAHSVDIGAFTSAAHTHSLSLSPVGSIRNISVDAEDWVILSAGNYTIKLQVYADGAVAFNGVQQLSALAVPVLPTIVVEEVVISSVDTLAAGFSNVPGLVTGIELPVESWVYLDTSLTLTSNDNSAWAGNVRFSVDGVGEPVAASFGNPFVLPTLSGATSSNAFVVDPPATSTSTAGAHGHSVGGSTSTNSSHSHSASGSAAVSGAHNHVVDIGAFSTAAHSHSISLSPAGSARKLTVQGAGWVLLPAGNHSIQVQAESSGSVVFGGEQRLSLLAIPVLPSSTVETAAGSSSAALENTFSTVAPLTTTITINEESIVYFDASLRLSANDNSNWSGASRFVVNGVPETQATGFGNPYLLPALSGTTSTNTVTIDPPATTTSNAGAHSHSISGSTSVVLSHSHSVSGTAFGVGDHNHSLDIGAFNSSGHNHSVVLNPVPSSRQLSVSTQDWLVLPAGTHVIEVQSLATGLVQYSGEQQLRVLAIPMQWADLRDGGRSLVSSEVTAEDLTVTREISVPLAASSDFARTVDSFYNPTGEAIATTARVVGNLGSDAATIVFATSDGDNTVETTDWWIGTDDADGTGGPAVIHLVHGPIGLQPNVMNVLEDNIEWEFDLTIAPGETLRLAYFTVLGTTRSEAVARVEALVTSGGLTTLAREWLTPEEAGELANFEPNEAPSDIQLNGGSVIENRIAGQTVGTLTAEDANQNDEFTYELVSGEGDADNGSFEIVDGVLKTVSVVDYEQDSSLSIRVRATDLGGSSFEKSFIIQVIDLPEVVGSPVFGDGTAQRSLIDRIVVTFDEDVDLEPGAFTLVKRGTSGAVITNITKQVNGMGQTEVSITFSGIYTRGTFNALVDGYYQLTVDGTKVKRNGESLDSNADGYGGDSLVIGDEESDKYFALFGDATGDGIISLGEFNQFRSTFGKSVGDVGYNPIYDFDGSSVGLADFNQFRSRFGQPKLPWT